MGKVPKIWLTMDTDDVFHHPKFQGHPTRSKKKTEEKSISNLMRTSIHQFEKWHNNNINSPITIFIIAEQLECEEFKLLLEKLLLKSQTNGGKITIGCHGYTHTCWSAFKPNKKEFKKDLVLAEKIIKKFAKGSWRPWFRAPGGYIAPWMAEVLKERKFVLDSSINPTIFLRIKSGKSQRKIGFNGWRSIQNAMDRMKIIERPWLTTFFPALPACGPALHIPILKTLAHATWKKYSKANFATEDEIINPNLKITTVYWHLLDHSKYGGAWSPPLIQK